MICESCGGLTKVLESKNADGIGTRRTLQCKACQHVFRTLEVPVAPRKGRDAAAIQAAQIRGEEFTPSKNTKRLRMEDSALSTDFRWAVLNAYPCTVKNVADATQLKYGAVVKRFKVLTEAGMLRRFPAKSHTAPAEYQYVPSFRRNDGDHQR